MLLVPVVTFKASPPTAVPPPVVIAPDKAEVPIAVLATAVVVANAAF